MGIFIITACIGEVAFCLDLKGQFTHTHPVFHVGLFLRFVAGSDGIRAPEPIKVKDT